MNTEKGGKRRKLAVLAPAFLPAGLILLAVQSMKIEVADGKLISYADEDAVVHRHYLKRPRELEFEGRIFVEGIISGKASASAQVENLGGRKSEGAVKRLFKDQCEVIFRGWENDPGYCPPEWNDCCRQMRPRQLMIASHLLQAAEDPAKYRSAGCIASGCHSDLPRTVQVKHDPIEKEGCSICHEGPRSEHPSSSGEEFTLKGDSIKGLCFGCHKDLAARIMAAKYLHTPVARGLCTTCHNPHGGPYPKLLVKFIYPNLDWGDSSINRGVMTLCWECHDVNMALEESTDTLTNFRDGRRNLHFVHVNQKKGRTCKACHDPHAGNQEMHIRDNVPFGAGGWKLPIDYTRKATGGSCVVGCHREMSYDRGPSASEGAVP